MRQKAAGAMSRFEDDLKVRKQKHESNYINSKKMEGCCPSVDKAERKNGKNRKVAKEYWQTNFQRVYCQKTGSGSSMANGEQK